MEIMRVRASVLNRLLREAIAADATMDGIDDMVATLHDVMGKLQLEYASVELHPSAVNRLRAVGELANRITQKVQQITRAN